MKELFVFWQFNGDNRCYCQLHCPECYGRDTRNYKHYWNGDAEKWEHAFERLNRDIYFVFSYGEALLSRGFYECVDMIGRHENWTLNIISNLMANPEQLLNSRLAKEKRLFITACWHPEGVDNPKEDWETFKKHIQMVKDAGVPLHVMMVWFPPVTKHFAMYFEWLDQNGFRVGVRRYVDDKVKHPLIRKILRRALPKWFAGKYTLAKYTEAEKGFIYAYTCPKVTHYGLDLASPRGMPCNAGKDMMLVKHDGTASLCASCYGSNHEVGNVFNPNFKLNNHATRCPTNNCGGDFGMLVLPDSNYGVLPERMWRDTFISQVENIPQSNPVAYPRRGEMLKWLGELKREKSLS